MRQNEKINTQFKAGLFALILFPLSAIITNLNAQCCTYTLSMHDSYGDGWNGASLQVSINGSILGNFSASGYASSQSFSICQGDELSMEYTPGEWENENTYQLYDNGWELMFSAGPNPVPGEVFSASASCSSEPTDGNHPCIAIEVDTGQCYPAQNVNAGNSGINPGCADFQGKDVWFVMQVPASGNIMARTVAGSLGDTGLAAWHGNSCLSISSLGCDDDGGGGYQSMLNLYNLTAGELLYFQVWGYGGGTGSFQLCIEDMGTVSLDSSELPIVMINTLGQTIVTDVKIDALMDIKYNGIGNITHLSDASNIYSGNIGIEIRGASSAGYPQTPYGIETRTATGENNNVPLLSMPEESDWVLLSNYNDRSLMRNTLAFTMFAEMGHYSPRTMLCELVIDSTYRGIYLFGEKIKRDNNRVDIAKLDPDENSGDDLTGGYILQQNYWDASNSFESNYAPIDHPELDVHFVFEYPKPDVITTEQKEYIAAYVDSLETALYSDSYADAESGYRKYLDVQSFIDYFIVNEVSRNNDGFKKSVFFYKDKNSNGGKLKAGPVWDFDWAWKNLWGCGFCENTDGSGWAYTVNDCGPDNNSCGWYVRMLQDTTFCNELRCQYTNYRQTILSNEYIFARIDSIGALVQHAQARHFQKWPILGVSGPAPEVNPVAETYAAELDTLKAWIAIRLAWLDENLPGNCWPTGPGNSKEKHPEPILCYPNPTNGTIRFEGYVNSSATLLRIYDATGRLCESIPISAGVVAISYSFTTKGVYSYLLTDESGMIQSGKIVVL